MRFFGALLLGMWLVGGVTAQAPKIVVHPERIDLVGRRDRHGILVTAVAADGTTRDITAEAKLDRSKTDIRRRSACDPLTPDMDAAAREEAVRDLFWALINTKEFAFNH
jgi:hypothetical protein